MEEGRRSGPAMHELAKLVVVWAGGKTLKKSGKIGNRTPKSDRFRVL